MSDRRGGKSNQGMTIRARRRREEAVRRLVADIQSKTNSDVAPETHDWLVASTVATALEKGLDRDLHTELVQEAKDNAGRIGQVCHDHADVFLNSVAQVAALATPCADLADGLKDAQNELHDSTAGPMHQTALNNEQAHLSFARAQVLSLMVQACQGVAVQLERARKHVGRPRAALDAVDKARTALTTPIDSLFIGHEDLWKETIANETMSAANQVKKLTTLEQTPFGKRALVVLPRIEVEVLQSAKRGLNRWFASLRNADAGKIGRSAIRESASSAASGPGSLGLGGTLPASFLWRAQMAENWIARSGQSSKVARACRQGYWFDRDAPKDAEKLETLAGREGCERYAESIASAFGWYRCWEDGSSLLVDPLEFASLDASNRSHSSRSNLGGSRHGLSGSRHGLSGSRHGSSRHGKGRSLGFRATTNSRSQAFQEMTSNLGATSVTRPSNQSSLWGELLLPAIFLSKPAVCKEDDDMMRALPESVFPVRRAEVAFSLLEKTDEFIHYYETNRFGETKVGGDGKDAAKSSLSALTGDDVTLGSDRTFFGKMLPHICASVVGFSAVESVLEFSNFQDDDETKSEATVGLKPSRFRESSEKYERTLSTELGHLIRSRYDRANLGELVRMSRLLVSFRAALKLVHPSSTARRVDRDLLALEADLLSSAVKISQDEQLKATVAIVNDDQKMPMLVSESLSKGKSSSTKDSQGVPDPEEIGLPFGLNSMKQTPQKSEVDFQEQSVTSYNQAPMDEAFTFSHSVPVIMRSLHARAITCATFALSQLELGQKFPDKKKGSPVAAFVLECMEECVGSAVIGMKDTDSIFLEGSVEKAVQIMANISAVQQTLPRFFGTVLRGLFHIGCVKADEVDDTFVTAEKSLKAADKACDAQVGSTYSLVYEICRSKIDSHIKLSLDNFNWVAKSAREKPNPYCEGLIGYMKTVFMSLGPMDEGSRAGLHFSCCGHVSERLVQYLSGRPGDASTMDDSAIPPLQKIDAFGLKNMSIDCEELERFADSTGIPSLRDCFGELRVLTEIMLDKDMPTLMMVENSAARRRKYSLLSMDKVASILEKYVGTGMFAGGGSRNADMLFLEKKELGPLLKLVRSQV